MLTHKAAVALKEVSDELLSGISRGVDALLMAVALAAGIGISFGISYYIGGLL